MKGLSRRRTKRNTTKTSDCFGTLRVPVLREIIQEVALAGLYRAGYFEKAAFYDGTALSIFLKLLTEEINTDREG